jgi:transcriptional regulator with XRE-family HTH domain
MDNKEIGLYLKGLRTAKGLSQVDIAKVCSVSHQAVSKWEKGESLPDLSSLQMLGSFYKITIDEILVAETNEDKNVLKSNNKNKEIIKMTMSFLILLVLLLPFSRNGNFELLNGYQLIFKGSFGFETLSAVVLLMFLLFQIVFSVFTIMRVISFSKGNIYLNRVLTILVTVLVLYDFVQNIIFPAPMVIFTIYLISIYIISTRVLVMKNEELGVAKKETRFEPHVYLIFFFIVMSALPVYFYFFNDWIISVYNNDLYYIVALHIVSMIALIIGFELRDTHKRLCRNLRFVTVYSIRLLYLIIFYMSYTESRFFEFSNDRYDGIVIVMFYIGFDLMMSSLYRQSINLKGKTKPLFKSE